MKLIFSFLLSFHFLRPRSISKHLQKLIYSSLYVKKDIAYDRKFSIVAVSVVISPEWVHLSTSAHKTGYMLLRANNKRRRTFCSPSKTLTVKNFWYVRHNPLLIFLLSTPQCIIRCMKKEETANHVEKKFARIIRYKIYAT